MRIRWVVGKMWSEEKFYLNNKSEETRETVFLFQSHLVPAWMLFWRLSDQWVYLGSRSSMVWCTWKKQKEFQLRRSVNFKANFRRSVHQWLYLRTILKFQWNNGCTWRLGQAFQNRTSFFQVHWLCKMVPGLRKMLSAEPHLKNIMTFTLHKQLVTMSIKARTFRRAAIQ